MASAVGLSSVGLGAVGVGAPYAVAAPLVDLTILNVNDFHGRIGDDPLGGNLATNFACTIQSLRSAAGPNTLLLGAGDLVGASLPASSAAGDEPTVRIFKELGLVASAVGNHEFDQGVADLKNRLVGADGMPYLVANVVDSATGAPILPAYQIETVDGIRVAVIGAVADNLPVRLPAGYLDGLTVLDPVDAVNATVAAIGSRADVFIAEYHESLDRYATGITDLTSALAADPIFAHLVNDTSPQVSALFMGHRHRLFVYDAPVASPYGTRPAMETGYWAATVGEVKLTIDKATMSVVGYTARTVPRAVCAPGQIAADPVLTRVDSIVRTAMDAVAPKPAVATLHRFYKNDGTHFYTASEAEAAQVRGYGEYRYEGVAGTIVAPDSAVTSGLVPLYRFYKPGAGTHFYTASEYEASLVRGYPEYRYEGIAGYVHPGAVAGASAMYRFYKVGAGTHFYTSSAYEASLVAGYAEYRAEGVAFYLAAP